MTTYTAVTSGQRDADSPIDTTLIGQMIDNPIAMLEKAAGAPVLANSYVVEAMLASGSVTNGKIGSGAVSQAKIGVSAVGQPQLKTAAGTVSVAVLKSSTEYIAPLPGGTYGFRIQTKWNHTGTNYIFNGYYDGSADSAYTSCGISFTNNSGTIDSVAYGQERYVQASPPYDLGDGEIGQFIFALVDNGTGKIDAAYAAPDAPWHHNGPTDIRAEFYDAQGRGWRWKDVKEITWDAENNSQIVVVDRQLTEITQVVKQADMPLIPHPFIHKNLTGKTVVLLDPVADLTWHMAEMHEQGEIPNELLHHDYLRIDNVALDRAGPPGVMVASYKWRSY